MWIALIVLGLVLAALYFAGRARLGGVTTAADKPAEIYLGLRGRMLATTAPEMGVAPADGGPVAYGVLLDLAMGSGTATNVSLATGDTSMYTSTGGGVLGGIGHESCRRASQQFIAVAQTHLEKLRKTESFPLPPTGVFRFYVLTTQGVFTAEDREEIITQGQGELAGLFHAGNEVITQIRLSTAKR